MALKYHAAEKASVVHNDGGELLIAGKNWSVKITEEPDGSLVLLTLHNDNQSSGGNRFHLRRNV